MKNSTKRLLLLAAATVTAASAMAVGMGNSYMANASTVPDPVETSAVFENDQYTGTYTRTAEKTITDSGPIRQYCDVFSWLDFPSWENMAVNGYQYVTVTIRLEMREKDRGYQQVFLYPNTKEIYDSFVDRIEVQYGGDGVTKDFGEVYFNFKTIPLSNLVVDNKLGLVVRYGATGGGEDDWVNRNMSMTVTVSADEESIRQYSYAYGQHL
ncbi:MAG: hypothetical protein K2K60_05445 [Clostridia bacterium]|nr:hypothetical protein [Clostridia bacterium]